MNPTFVQRHSSSLPEKWVTVTATVSGLVGISLVVFSLWLWQDASAVAQFEGQSNIAIAACAVRCASLAVFAAAQLILLWVVRVIVGQNMRLDWIFGTAWVLVVVGAVSAAVAFVLA